jgi:hypothetical protein
MRRAISQTDITFMRGAVDACCDGQQGMPIENKMQSWEIGYRWLTRAACGLSIACRNNVDGFQQRFNWTAIMR